MYFEPLESRRMLAGVTIIAHGYGFATTNDAAGINAEPLWETGMAHEIGDRLAQTGRNVSYADVVVAPTSAGLAASVRSFDGPNIANSNSAELVLTVDWTQANGYVPGPYFRTQSVATVITEALTDPAFLPSFGLGRALASLPIHLIGHSRGGSLVASIARQLGEHGIWVDQLTMLDPTPISQDEVPTVTQNVVYSDEVWQSGLIGVFWTSAGAVNGSQSRKIQSSFDGYGLLGTHSNTHLWYSATIDTSGDAFDGDKTLTEAARSSWFSAGEGLGTLTGFANSRIAGGDSSRPAIGLAIAQGGAGARIPILTSGPQWPNVGSLSIEGGLSVASGQQVRVDFRDQSVDAPASIELSLDADTNPWNGNELRAIASTASSAGSGVGNDHASWTIAAYPPGTYYLRATVRFNGFTRVAYISHGITITDSGTSGSHQLIAGKDSTLSASTGADGTLVIGLTNTQKCSVVVTHPINAGWSAANINRETGSPPVTGQTASWIDPKDGLRYAAACVAGHLTLFKASVNGAWTSLPLGDAISSDLQEMLGADGRVHLIGLNAARELVRFDQDAFGNWSLANITKDDLVAAAQAVPDFSPAHALVSYATSWGGLNVAGIDAYGSVWSIWWAPGQVRWTSSNLTSLTGLPAVTGGLAVYLTAWNGINIAGLDADGRVQVAWWVPAFVGEWKRDDMTASAGGATFEADSLTSYVSSWGGLNIAGRNRVTGAIEIYWWSPERQGQGREWQTAQLSQTVANVPAIYSIRGLAGTDQSLNVFGETLEGDIVRLHWQPGGAWGFENVTQLATWTH